jgi:predicted nucleic acid-binding protein
METKSNTIIADSSALVSLFVASDSNHAAAVAGASHLVDDNRLVLIPAEIFAETINIVGKKFGHQTAVRVGHSLLDSAAFLIAVPAEATRLNALELLLTVPETVSFTDCLVMSVADEYKTREILGFDNAFRRKGYRVLATQEKEAA